jgi:hypothetical protein
MPNYKVQGPDGKMYKIRADTPEQAAAAFDEQPQTLGQKIKGELTGSAMKELVSGVKRSPEAFAEGAGSLMIDVAQGMMGLASPGNQAIQQTLEGQEQRFDEAVAGERAQDEAQAPGSVAVGDVTAGLLPVGGTAGRVRQVAVEAGKKASGRLGSFVSSISGATRQAAMEGMVLANTPYDADDDRTLRTVLGAALPGAVRAVAATPRGVVNFVARRAARRADTQTQQLRQTAAEAVQDDYTIAQASGDPRTARFASTTADVVARDTVRAQLDARVQNLRKTAQAMGGQKIMSDPERAKALHTIVKVTDSEISKAAGGRYTSAMDALAQSPEGKQVRVPIGPLKAEIASLTEELGNPLALVRQVPEGTKLAKILEELEKYPDDAKLTVTGLRRLEEGLNAGRSYGKAVIESDSERRLNLIRTRLKKAAQQSVEGGGNSPGFQRLKQIQGDYSQDMDRRRMLTDGVLNDLFGDKGLADPDTAFQKFIKASPESQRTAVALLNHRGPEHLQYFRKLHLDSILDDATRGVKAASESPLDVPTLLGKLNGSEIQDSPLYTAAEKKLLKANAADLRIILNHLPDPTKVGTDITPADTLINIVSRSPEFVARFVARAVTGLNAEKLMFTQEGRKALSTLRNLRGARAVEFDRSMAYLSYLIADEQQEPEAEEQVEQ